MSWVRSLVPNEKNCASCAISIGGQRAARHLDHRADQILDLDPLLLHRLRGDAIDDRLLIAKLLHVAHQRNHDLGDDLEPFLVQPAGRLDDGARLHLGDLGIGDAEPHAAMAEHRVELVELLDAAQQRALLVQLGPVFPAVSSRATSTISSSRLGRNSWSGGSMVRIVTGEPRIALKTP